MYIHSFIHHRCVVRSFIIVVLLSFSGLLDVDVYGPSLPVLVKPDDPAIHPSTIGPGVVKPIEHKGVKMISLGFVSPTVR